MRKWLKVNFIKEKMKAMENKEIKGYRVSKSFATLPALVFTVKTDISKLLYIKNLR